MFSMCVCVFEDNKRQLKGYWYMFLKTTLFTPSFQPVS